MNYKKWIFFFLGLCSLVMAYIGIILPGVPGIPFILLSAWFFLQSSPRLYGFMLNNKITGRVVKKYFSGDKVSAKAKWFVISQLWVSLIIAQIFFIRGINGYIIINSIGIVTSILIYKII